MREPERIEAEVYDDRELPQHVHLAVRMISPHGGIIKADGWQLIIAETGQVVADVYRAELEQRELLPTNDVVLTLYMDRIDLLVDGVIETTLGRKVLGEGTTALSAQVARDDPDH